LRPYSAGLLAFLIVTMLNSFKGWMVDLDPVNVYMWLFVGTLLKVRVLDRRASSARGTGEMLGAPRESDNGRSHAPSPSSATVLRGAAT
jgi:hypothetical protein